MNSDEKYIKDLIANGEHQQQDFKFEISNAKKIAKTLVAFANTDGGRLLIGVKDNGRISGIKTDEEYYMIEAAAKLYSRPEINFDHFKRNVEGKTILEVVIESSPTKPHYAKDEENRWLAYHRVDDNNYLSDYIQLQVWKRARREKGTFISYTEKERRVLEALHLSEKLELEELKEILSMKKKTLQQILINLVSLQAVQMVFSESKVFFRSNDER